MVQSIITKLITSIAIKFVHKAKHIAKTHKINGSRNIKGGYVPKEN